jgi:hypothetical protein
MDSKITQNSNQRKHRTSHLLEEPPILVYPTLAAKIGLDRAVVFQQLHFLLNTQRTANNQYNYVDGRWWVYNTYAQWLKYFPWLTEITMKRILLQLEKLSIVESRQGVKDSHDRRKWYTINYEAWETFCNSELP